MDEALKRGLLSRWGAFPPSFPRDIEPEVSPFLPGKNAVFLYGPRRAGKSTLAQRLVRSERSRYINFDDALLPRRMDASTIEELCGDMERGSFIVLDEVQNVSGWERWVRSCVDTERFHVIVTGSSGRLLSGEFATSLAGRGIGFLVLPLSFGEFSAHRSKRLEDYLDVGGYPDVVKARTRAEQDKLLESYFDLMMLKDVVERYEVRDVGALRSLAIFLLTNPGKTIGLRSLKHSLGLSFDAIRAYLGYLESAFLHFTVPHFAYSLKRSMEMPRKSYSYDLGLQRYVSRSFSPDLGRRAENAVAIELKRRGFELYYWRGRSGGEVDLVARKGAEATPINVCYADAPPEREVRSLLEFSEEFERTRTPLLLSTARSEGTELFGGAAVETRNVASWLLGKPPAGP